MKCSVKPLPTRLNRSSVCLSSLPGLHPAGGCVHHRRHCHPTHPRPPQRLGSPRYPGPRSAPHGRGTRGPRLPLIATTGGANASFPAQVTGPRPASATAPRAEIRIAFLGNPSKTATATPSAHLGGAAPPRRRPPQAFRATNWPSAALPPLPPKIKLPIPQHVSIPSLSEEHFASDRTRRMIGEGALGFPRIPRRDMSARLSPRWSFTASGRILLGRRTDPLRKLWRGQK